MAIVERIAPCFNFLHQARQERARRRRARIECKKKCLSPRGNPVTVYIERNEHNGKVSSNNNLLIEQAPIATPRKECKDLAVGDLIALRRSCGYDRDFWGKTAIITQVHANHCTVECLSEDATCGVAELWPGRQDVQVLNQFFRVGARVRPKGFTGPRAWLNGIPCTVKEHPTDGHPQWPDWRSAGVGAEKGRLYVHIVPDDPHRKGVSVPLRHLDPLVPPSSTAATEQFHIDALLRIAAEMNSGDSSMKTASV